MSYPIDLDEYRESQLIDELHLRSRRRRAGRCDYCNRPFNIAPFCKETKRHRGETE